MAKCNDGHEPIEWDGSGCPYCPLCALQVKYAMLERDFDRSKKKRQARVPEDRREIDRLKKLNRRRREKLLEIKRILKGRV